MIRILGANDLIKIPSQYRRVNFSQTNAFICEQGDAWVIFGVTNIYPWCGEAWIFIQNPGPAVLKEVKDFIRNNRRIFALRVETRIRADFDHRYKQFARWIGFIDEAVIRDWQEPGRYAYLMVYRG